jgi:hypothetical protein
MADLNVQHIPERLLQAAVSKGVSEKLGSFSRELAEFTKDMSAEDAKNAKLMLLEMMRNAFGGFYAKMQKRIETNAKSEE